MTPTWILDCDNTLYPSDSGLFARVNARITTFMEERLSIRVDEIDALRKRYWDSYGVTLGGLIAEWGVDPQQYLEYVHDIPIDDLMAPDPELARALERLPGDRVIFTNGSTDHAERVLNRLGIRELVGEVYDISFMEYIPKPRAFGYEKLLTALGIEPSSCWMVDDLAANLETARLLGMTTVLVGPAQAAGHHHIASPHALPMLYAEICPDG